MNLSCKSISKREDCINMWHSVMSYPLELLNRLTHAEKGLQISLLCSVPLCCTVGAICTAIVYLLPFQSLDGLSNRHHTVYKTRGNQDSQNDVA